MGYYTYNLNAGKAYRAGVGGKVLLIDSLGAASGVDVQIIKASREFPVMKDRKQAFKYVVDFDDVLFTAAVDCTIAVFLTNADVDLGFSASSLVQVAGSIAITNDAGHPVPVNIGGATITASNVSINNNLTTISNIAPVTAGLAQTLLSNDATLKRLRVRNSHATAVIAIGANGVTMANGAVQIQPGDVWDEDDAPGATWYVISDTAGVNVQLQGLK